MHSQVSFVALLVAGMVAFLASRHCIIPPLLFLLVVVWVLTGRRYKLLYIVYKTLPRDLVFLKRILCLGAVLWWREKRGHTVAQQFEAAVARHPDKVAFCFEGRQWTFREVSELSNRLGRFFLASGLARGDVVAVFMDSRPELVSAWLGLAKGGVVAALINSNLRAGPLVHCIRVAGCRAVIVGGELAQALNDIHSELGDIMIYQWNEYAKESESFIPRTVNLEKALSTVEANSLIDKSCGPRDHLLYIYTSGTTGLPKAAVITNIRYFFIASAAYYLHSLKHNDVLYNSLPLYHTSGGILGVGQVIVGGLTVVIRRTFSTSHFWSDCVKNNCTIAIYIGETCRYLLSSPMKDEETRHKLRLMYGNGLRQQIWGQFTHRFKVKRMCEMYGATESNAGLANTDGKIGAVGCLPRWLLPVYPVSLIKVDKDTGEPIRGKNGLCIICKPGECGMIVGKIQTNRAISDFSGYTDAKATRRKVLNDVFKRGDKVFSSGDLLMMDDFGYFYFVDRIGDTFRWKGENVSTTEVEAIISNIIDLDDAVVYGVEVPNIEGKAGMAAIVNETGKLDLEKLANEMKKNLPKYAIPLFLRVMSSLPKTETHKLKKGKLVQDGFDPTAVSDKLYFFQSLKTYVPLTSKLYNDIVMGKVKV